MSTRTIIAVLILLGAYFALSYDKRHAIAPAPSPTGCTEELMQCPDGSYVARTQPSCQFAQCPTKPVPPSISMGTILGTVGLSPACGGPVRIPPDENCNFKAYETSISFVGQNKTFKTTSSASGAYSINLPIGTYRVTAKGGEVLPRCPSDSVVVRVNQDTLHNIDCDSGLR